MATDISRLRNKSDNAEQVDRTTGIPSDQKLTAKEFNDLIAAVIENQSSVRKIKMMGTVYTPNEEGQVSLPNPAAQSDSYSAKLVAVNDFNTNSERVVKEKSLQVPLRFTSVLITGGERTNSGIDGTLTIRRSTSSNSNVWSVVDVITIPSISEDSSSYTTVDVGQYLQEGEQRIQLQASFQYQDENGDTKTASSVNITLATITFTNMQLTFDAQWQHPFSGSIELGYYVRGYGQMYLKVEIDDYMYLNGQQVTASIEAPVSVSIQSNQSFTLTNGLHTIRAWLAAAGDTTVISDVLESQVLYFDASTASAQEKTAAYVMISNVAQGVTPYVDTKLFEYAVYKYNAETVHLEVVFTDYQDNEILSQDLGNVAVGGASYNTFRSALPIPANISTVFMKLKVNGTIQGGRSWSLTVDQSIDFTPTSMNSKGFIFDASTRSNNEDHPERIINENTGNQVAATWSSGMVFNNASGYVESLDDQKHLHIPAGEWLKITGYDPLVFNGQDTDGTNFSGAMTMEFDVKITNVYNESVPVIRVGTGATGNVLGFEMLPLSAYFMTQQQRARGSQDVRLGEDERTHIAINIIRNISNSGLNFIRIFVNGIINREFTFSNSDVFVAVGGSGGIQIGSPNAEVDVYSIRIYKQSLSSSDIRQDYLAAIPSVTDKVNFYRKNNILDGNNEISYNLAKAQYSTMLWIPDDASKPYLPSYLHGSGVKYSTGTLKVIFRYRYDSGVHKKGDINFDLSRIYTHMSNKGQGTSSMTYWKWNQRYQFTDDSEVWTLNEALEKGERLESNGEPIQYGIFEEGGAHATKLDAKANWASSAQSHKMGMMNAYGALWKQIIGMSNPIYAADQKTRPCVLQEAFLFFVQTTSGDASRDDLGENDGSIEFSNFMTFGPAKNDKATWGLGVKSPNYVVGGSQKSMYTCLEGSSNGRPLAEAKIPWISDEVFYYYNENNEDDEKNETFVYNDDSQFDFDKGPSSEHTYGSNKTYDVPLGFTSVGNSMWMETEGGGFENGTYFCGGNTIKFYRRAFNFAYLNTHHLAVVDGDYNDFLTMVNNGTADQGKQYFVTRAGYGHARGDCFRYNPLSEKNNALPKWVNAGTTKDISTDDGYAVLNLFEDLEDYMPTSYDASNALSLRDAFITARLRRYRGDGRTTGSSLYWEETECDLCQAWGKVMAAKDNWCKNTYFVLLPNGKLTMYRDDDDTIMDKDNVGRTGAPYQVEEHDRFNVNGEWADESGHGETWDSTTGEYNTVQNLSGYYWNSQDSVLFTLREQTRGGVRSDMGSEMKLMVGTIFQEMVSLENSVDNFFQKYFFDIQEYFPAVAYNEVARLFYEEAKIHMDANVYAGRDLYTNNTDPMTQSLGDQLQGEKQWIKRRIPYMESFGHSSIFADARSGAGALSFRSALAAGEISNHSFVFKVKPHQFLYPAAGSESSTSWSEKRARPAEIVQIPQVNVQQDNNLFIHGINYLRSVGDFAEFPTTNAAITVVGERLEEWIVNEDGQQSVEIKSASITLSTPRLQRLVMRNYTALGSLGTDGLSTIPRLVSVDLRGCTGLADVQMPQTQSLTSAKFQSSLVGFSISNTPNLATLTFEGFADLVTFAIGNNGGSFDLQSILEGIYNAKITADTSLNALSVSHLDLLNVTTAFMSWLSAIPNLSISGTIALSDNAVLNFASKMALIKKFGNIDDSTNSLYVTYQRRVATDIKIVSPMIIRQRGSYDVSVVPTNANANDFWKVELLVSTNSFGISYNEQTGKLDVPSVAVGEAYITLTGRYYNNPSDQTSYLEVTKSLAIYDRQPQAGDFVFYDGDWNDEWDGVTPIAGICFYVNPNDPTDRRMAATANIVSSYKQWGIADWGTNTGFSGMTIADTPNYNVFSVPNMDNVPNDMENSFTLSANNYKDDNGDSQGFKVFTEDQCLYIGLTELDENIFGHQRGETMPRGLANTLKIIKHRNLILNDSTVNLEIPAASGSKTETTRLSELIAANIANNDNKSKYQQFYYPAASYCYAYQPTEGVFPLADKFKVHNWYLPSLGELARIAWYNSKGYTVGTEDAVFAKAYQVGKWDANTNYGYNSSSQHANTYNPSVTLQSGAVYMRETRYSEKNVIPCCRF